MQPLEIGSLRLFPFGAVTAAALAAGVWMSRRGALDRMTRRTVELFWLMALPLGLVLETRERTPPRP